MKKDDRHDPTAELKLRAMFEADMRAEEDADELFDVVMRMQRWEAEPVSAAMTDALVERLMGEMPAIVDKPSVRMRLKWALLILTAQVRIVQPMLWLASALVIGLGALVTLWFYQVDNSSQLPLVIVAPLVAACGVAFLYGQEADPALELQLASPVSPRFILLARLVVLFGFNLVVTLVCSVGLAVIWPQISLLPLIYAWLAPMTFLTGLAFLLSVLFFDALISVLISMLLWGLTVAR
ncbi:MAG: hypothetical protein J0L63_14175, partial [Anaerolineae bacterium]|nr:hypothetical protein [Anaerolineae bacterium]